jgi:predicted O-methyltransferase YrrM
MIATDTRPELDDLPQGWFNHGPQVLALLDQHKPQVIVELGTWLGASAIAMARSVRRWGGTVTCIDTWAGELNDAGGSPDGKSPLMLLSCARNMVQAGVSASVRLIPATTVSAAQWWTLPIDFLYVDADHSYRGCLEDLHAWLPHVTRHGLLVGDDYGHPRYPGVQAAWDEFEHQSHMSTGRKGEGHEREGLRGSAAGAYRLRQVLRRGGRLRN